MTFLNAKERYQNAAKQLLESTGEKNVNALPKIVKVSVNVGLGLNRQNKDMVEYIEKSLQSITGQKPVKTAAKKAVAGFKIREGEIVGMRVTLRGNRMNDFINRLLNITLPRIRDFRGLDPKQLDKQGSLTIGFKDQVPFAELGHDIMDKPFGLSITLTIANSNPEKSTHLLQSLGFPLKNG